MKRSYRCAFPVEAAGYTGTSFHRSSANSSKSAGVSDLKRKKRIAYCIAITTGKKLSRRNAGLCRKSVIAVICSDQLWVYTYTKGRPEVILLSGIVDMLPIDHFRASRSPFDVYEAIQLVFLALV
jgi:hypothetical protein